MDDRFFHNRFGELADLIAFLTLPRWPWREPTAAESQPRPDGTVLIWTRDETRRARCLAAEHDARHRLVFSVWVDEERDGTDAADEWRERERFCRIFQVKQDASGMWGARDLCITSLIAREFRYLASERLRELASAGVDSTASVDNHFRQPPR